MRYLRNIVLSGIFALGLVGCPDKKEIVEIEREEDAILIYAENNYFLNWREFDFIIDEKQAIKVNEETALVVRYKVTYEYVKNGDVDESGKQKDLWTFLDYKFVDVRVRKEVD